MSQDTTRLAAAWQDADTRYTQVPRALLRMCTAREYQLISALLGYRWHEDAEIFPRVKLLAEEMGCKVRTVQYAMRGLEAKGLIVPEAHFRTDGGQSSNRYRIGPMLAPLLAPLPEQASTTASAWVRTPVQDGAGRKRSPERNYRRTTNERLHSRIPTDPSAYLETREGTLRRR